jgi:hypothetical protein
MQEISFDQFRHLISDLSGSPVHIDFMDFTGAVSRPFEYFLIRILECTATSLALEVAVFGAWFNNTETLTQLLFLPNYKYVIRTNEIIQVQEMAECGELLRHYLFKFFSSPMNIKEYVDVNYT